MTALDPAADGAAHRGVRTAGGASMLGATALGMVLADRPQPEVLAELAGDDPAALVEARGRVLALDVGDPATRRRAAALLGEAVACLPVT